MKYEKTQYGGTIEILAADDFVALPVSVKGSTVVKAGTPVKADGTVLSATTDAQGILLYDVDPTSNPNGAMLVQGVINLTKATTHSGVSYTASDLLTVLPGIVCRENI